MKGKGKGGKADLGLKAGKGIGEKGTTQPWGKAGGKGIVQEFTGKGFPGACWSCGQIGHQSKDCPKGKGKGGRGIREVEAEADECAVEIGGVWNLCAVEKVQSGWTGIPFFPQVFFASLKELKAPREVFLDRLRFA